MRRIRKAGPYIHQHSQWPVFYWDGEQLAGLLANVHRRQGKIMGRMEALGFRLQDEAMLQTLTLDVLKSSEIEGEILPPPQVRSSIARRLGIETAGLVPTDRHVEGVVEMMLDATQHYLDALNDDRLFRWHASLFPAAGHQRQKIVVGHWRKNTTEDPMQVVSGAMGHEHIHFIAPDSAVVEKEMKRFLNWFNNTMDIHPVLKAGLAHLWFVTIHPFDDGNGRIARAIADLQLARADESPRRFYSMSAQIRQERNAYYEILEKTQRGTMDVTEWLNWFLLCLGRSLTATEQTLSNVLKKARFWENHNVTKLNERQRLILQKLMDQFEGKLTSSKWAKLAKCSHDTALRDILDLIEKKILIKEAAGGRSTNYLLKEI